MAVGLLFGQACEGCTNGKCVDKPTAAEPLCVPMPDGSELEVTTCPREFCGSESFRIVRLAQLTEKGLPPVLAGSLDQSYAFMEACRIVWNDWQAWKNKLGIT